MLHKIFYEFMSTCLDVSDSFLTPWTEDRQAPLSMRFPRLLQWAMISCSMASSLPRDRACVSFISCITGRLSLNPLRTPQIYINLSACRTYRGGTER